MDHSTQKNINGSNGNCARGKNPPGTCSASEARSEDKGNTKYSYPSLFPILVTLESIFAVSDVGYLPVTILVSMLEQADIRR